MGTFNAPAILRNPKWQTTFEIRRYSTAMVNGRAVRTPIDIVTKGVVVPSGNLGMIRTAEAEQQGDGITVFCESEIRTGSGDTGAPADDIVWHGQLWQVISQDDFSEFGFYVVQCSLAEPGGREEV